MTKGGIRPYSIYIEILEHALNIIFEKKKNRVSCFVSCTYETAFITEVHAYMTQFSICIHSACFCTLFSATLFMDFNWWKKINDSKKVSA